MGAKWSTVCAVLIGLAPIAPAADPVTLETADGLRIEGTLTELDGRHLRLGTIYGPMLFDGAAVTCSGAGCPDPDNFVPDLRIRGEEGLSARLLPVLIEAYARQNGFSLRQFDGAGESIFLVSDTKGVHLRLRLSASGVADALDDLKDGEVQMVLSAREIAAEERAALRREGLGDLTADRQSVILGLSGLVPVVTPRRSLRQIEVADLVAVLTGQISDFGELGGAAGPITVYLGPAGSSFEQAFADRLMEGEVAALRSDVVRVANETELWRRVSDDPNGFGLVAITATGAARPLRISGGCGLSVAAEKVNLMTEDYPLTLPLFLYFPELPRAPATENFILWLQSVDAARVVARTGLAGLVSEEIPLDRQGERLANAIRQAGTDVSLAELQRLLNTLDQGVRLTPTFRFEVGSTRLDAQSRANVQRLAAEIMAGRYDGQRLILAGFTDARGPAGQNRDLARARAGAVARRLNEALPEETGVSIETAAFGEAMPMACDVTEAERQVNRRVEVWLAPLRPDPSRGN